MKTSYSLLLSLAMVLTLSAQDTKVYHPEAIAEQDIEQALKKATAEGKYVLIQGGGNWCGWCILDSALLILLSLSVLGRFGFF